MRHPRLVPAFDSVKPSRKGNKSAAIAVPECLDQFALAYRDSVLKEKGAMALARELERDLISALIRCNVAGPTKEVP